MNLGYCCINTELQSKGIFTSRGMRKATFEYEGLDYVSELSIKNLTDLLIILKWNVANNIFNFRISSELFPWGFTYDITTLPQYNKIDELLKEIGNYVKSNNIRVTFHPSHFNVLGSNNPLTVEKTIKELNHHNQIFDLMGLEANPYYCINIHIATTKPSKEIVAQQFCDNFQKLNINTQKRLTVENDDSVTQWSVLDLYNLIYKNIEIPIVFDEYHFLLGPQDQTMHEAFTTACSTWKVKPLIHLSSCRRIEDLQARIEAHADFIYEQPDNFEVEIDVDLECKMKEQGVLQLRKQWNNLPKVSDMSVAKRLLEMNKRDPNRKKWGEALGFFPISLSLTIKKGDNIELKTGEEGVITKYSSNSIIHVKTSSDILVVEKNQIKRVI